MMGQNCVDSSRNAAGDQNHEEDNDLWENAEDSSTENSDMEEDEEIFWVRILQNRKKKTK